MAADPNYPGPLRRERYPVLTLLLKGSMPWGLDGLLEELLLGPVGSVPVADAVARLDGDEVLGQD